MYIRINLKLKHLFFLNLYMLAITLKHSLKYYRKYIFSLEIADLTQQDFGLKNIKI